MSFYVKLYVTCDDNTLKHRIIEEMRIFDWDSYDVEDIEVEDFEDVEEDE